MRRCLVLLPVLGALVFPAALAHAGSPSRATVTVRSYSFTPDQVTIKKGGRVTWVFRSGNVKHNVHSPGHFRSPHKSSGSWSFTFKKTGTFTYYCDPHPWMTGRVIVRRK